MDSLRSSTPLRPATAMLERVAVGQTRFLTPGLATDARGIALGRYGVLLFSTFDQAVGWLRTYSQEAALDDLLPELSVLAVKTKLGSHAFVIKLPTLASVVLDRAGRCARLVGGSVFTGTSRHFVRFRDDHASYGYDAVELGEVEDEVDFVLHDQVVTHKYVTTERIDVRGLVFQLSLRRVKPARMGVPAGFNRDASLTEEDLLFAIAPGLGASVARYLARHEVRAEVARARGSRAALFRGSGPRSYVLLRAAKLPARMVRSLLDLPGVTGFAAATKNVFVEVGHEHPISLSSLSSLFPAPSLFLFFGRQNVVDEIAGPVMFSDVRQLVPVPRVEAARYARLESTGSVPFVSGIVPRLVPAASSVARVAATLLAWEDAPKLKKLVYLLPSSLLRGYRVAFCERGILIFFPEGGTGLPLGIPLVEKS